MKKTSSPRKKDLLSIGIVTFCILLFIVSCQNEGIDISQERATISTDIKQLKNWYELNNSVSSPNNWINSLNPNWQQVKIIENDKEYIYEIELNNPNEIFIATDVIDPEQLESYKRRSLLRLLIFKNKTNKILTTCIMNIVAEQNFKTDINQTHYQSYTNFTGRVNFYETNGQFANGWRIEQGEITKFGTPSSLQNVETVSNIAGKRVPCGVINFSYYQTYCYSITTGFVITTHNPDGSKKCYTKWFYASTIKYCEIPDPIDKICGDEPCGDNEGNGGSGIGNYIPPTANMIATIVFVGPKTPIKDILAYLKCFDLSQGARITIYVDQPIANSPDAWSVDSNKNTDVGHTFIAIQQGNIRRVFGYYPKTTVDPSSPNDPKAFGDDQGHAFDVSVSIPINSSQLLDVIGYANNAPSTYNLNTYNCTDFAIEVGNLIGLGLPDSYGYWYLGGGSNPGQLGQNIRKMALPVNASRQITESNAASNEGICN